MPTLIAKPGSQTSGPPRQQRTSASERRRGFRLLIISLFLAGTMFALWWLVATTNREGHHDAELLPLVTLATLVPATYHLLVARYLRSRGR